MGGTGRPLGKTFFLQCQRRHTELPKIPTLPTCAACLDKQCRSISCIRCKPVMAMMTGLTPFDANCRIVYTSGRTSTTGRKRSMETYLRIDLEEIIEYTSIRKTIHRGYTLTKWIRAN